jgi:hypothetical protein
MVWKSTEELEAKEVSTDYVLKLLFFLFAVDVHTEPAEKFQWISGV